MQFSISHLVPGVTRSEYENLFFDESLNIMMCERLKLERKLISSKREGADFQREVEVTMRRHVPGWVAKIVDEHRFVYTESMRYRFGEPPSRAHWRITPKMFSRQVDCAGTVTFEPHPKGVMRRVDGQVDVRISGLGTILERFAVREIEKSFTEAAELTREWLQEHRPRKAR